MSSRALRRLGLETSQASNKIPSTTTSILVPSSGKNCPSASDEEILHEEIQAHVIPKGNTFALLGDEDEGAVNANASGSDHEPSTISKGESPEVAKKKKNKHKKKSRGGHKGRSSSPTPDDPNLVLDLGALDFDLHSKPARRPQPAKTKTQAPEIPHEQLKTLSINSRFLLPDYEIAKRFGTSIAHEAQRERISHAKFASPLVRAKGNWPVLHNNGVSMTRVEESSDAAAGVSEFAFVHSGEYRETQQEFWDAVESLDPDRIINLYQSHGFYHADTLLQLSDIMRIGDDSATAADLVERALFVHAIALHPLCSLTGGLGARVRVRYRVRENRAFFLALFRHIHILAQKSFYRTALELCKVHYWYPLDFEEDPLGDLLYIDYLALRAREYQWIIDFFEAFKSTKGLSLLPNWAYSVALARYHVARRSQAKRTAAPGPRNRLDFSAAAGKQRDCSSSSSASASSEQIDQRSGTPDAADLALREALLQFPGVLVPLLEKCSITPDEKLAACKYLLAKTREAPLRALELLYVGRTFTLWREMGVLRDFLERNVAAVVEQLSAPAGSDAAPSPSRMKRFEANRVFYNCAPPRNVIRHIVLSDVKEAIAALGKYVANLVVLNYDPVPPENSVESYTRRTRTNTGSDDHTATSMFDLFFRSILPSFGIPSENQQPSAFMPPGVAQVGAGQVLNLMNMLQPPAPGGGREAAGAAAGAEAAAAAAGGEGAGEAAAAAGNNMNAAVAHLRQALERIVVGARQQQPAAAGQAQAGAAGNAEGDGEGELDEVHLRELDSDEDLD